MSDASNDKPAQDGKKTPPGADAIRDTADFGQSSDYVQTGTTGRYTGGGPEESAPMAGRDGQGNNAGSQAAWQNPEAQSGQPGQPKADEDEHKTADDPHNVGLQSRSADPGQSSYGGFSGEGTSPSDKGPAGDESA